MFIRNLLTLVLALVYIADATRSPLPVRKYAGEVVPGSYIVKVKNGVSPTNISQGIGKRVKTFSDKVFHGFIATLKEEEVIDLLNSPDIEYVEEDGIFHVSNISDASILAPISQINAPWNLARLSQDTPVGNPPYTYTYGPAAGAGVDIYVVDTGVFIQHSEFGGRASWGATFGGFANVDGNGHGTHIAGTTAGTTFGVAKKANIIAVKVLSDAGSGSLADIIAGLSWVAGNVRSTGRKSIVLLAVGGAASTALDNAVINVINTGITVVTVAGGSNADAVDFSPTRVAQAITVAASTQTDGAASFSNWGAIVDLYAPGQNIVSAWIGSPTATANLSGVSMAAAHVAGLAAYILSLTGPIPPATVANDMIIMSVKNVLTGVRAGTANRLASNNVGRIGITI